MLFVEVCYFEVFGLEKLMFEDGYCGEDIIVIGKCIVEEYGDCFVNEEESECFVFFCEYGLKYELEKLCKDLENFCVLFDVWYFEILLY